MKKGRILTALLSFCLVITCAAPVYASDNETVTLENYQTVANEIIEKYGLADEITYTLYQKPQQTIEEFITETEARMQEQAYLYATQDTVILPYQINTEPITTYAAKSKWEYDGCGYNLKMGCRYDIVNNRAQNFRETMVVPTFLGSLSGTHYEQSSWGAYGVESGKGMQIRTTGKYYQEDATHTRFNEINGLVLVAWFAKNYT